MRCWSCCRQSKAGGERLNFSDYVLVEQVRLLEENQADHSIAVKSDNFEHALLQRAQQLNDTRGWAATNAAPEKWYRRALLALLILFALLGFAAVVNALSDSDGGQSINIYWLLLVLLGFNTVSLLLWLLGCVGNSRGLIRGSVSSLPLSVQRWFTRVQRQQKQGAYTAWYDSTFAGRSGVWRLSTISHSLWLVYLGAGLLSLLLLFSVRQYDFVWGTTLLSGDAFVTLTDWLARPLQIFGIAVPDAQQVMNSRSGTVMNGAMTDAGAAFRRHWAVFLLGAVAVYGILPRLLCFGVSSFLSRRAQNKFRPDYYLPYYVDLRHQLLPESSNAEVVDADPAPPSKSAATINRNASTLQLPAEYELLGFELYTDIADCVDINVVNRQTQSDAELKVDESEKVAIVIVVEANAAPDRGSERKLKRLFDNGKKERWLLLHSEDSGDSLSNEAHSGRLGDWYRVAQASDVPVDHIHALTSKELQTLKNRND